MDRIIARYRIVCEASQAEKTARYIAVEQTVEIPESLIDDDVNRRVVGKVESVQAADQAFIATISYDPELAVRQVPQLFNLIYGNVSIQKDIRLVELSLPETFTRHFRGPNFGIEGIRKKLGVAGRPLLATALKPNGAPVKRLAEYARDFTLGGGDIVKDDQNLSDASAEAFAERVARCQEAVTEANRKTGGHTIYCPILTAPHEEVERRFEMIRPLGVSGILAAPMLIGLDRLRQLSQKYSDGIFIAHPSLTGAFFSKPSHGIEPGVLLGQIFRLLGADASIFPNVGGRFSFTRAECIGIRDRLRGPFNQLKPAFPMPAGGMNVENLPSLIEDYGTDAILLIGGAILGRPEGVRKGTENLRKILEGQRVP